MDFNKIQNLVKSRTAPSRWMRGVKYYNNKLVDHITFDLKDSILTFEGMVESEFINEVYPSSISIDINDFKLVGGNCTCEDFKSKSSNTSFFICKHLAATSIAGIQSIKRNMAQDIIDLLEENNKLKNIKTTPNALLLSHFDNTQKEKVNLEVNIDVQQDKIVADFKIGIDKMYVLKNLKEFCDARNKNVMIEYGKNFIYNPNIHYFSESDEEILDIIDDTISLSNNIFQSSYTAKFLNISVSGFKRFLQTLGNKEFSLKYQNKLYSPKIFTNTLPVAFDLKKYENKITLTTEDEMPIPLTSRGDVVLYFGEIYLLSNLNAKNYKQIYKILKDFKDITFDNEESESLLSNLVPKIKQFSSKINLDEEIKNNIVTDFNVEFYFDLKTSNIVCDLKFVYEDENKSKYVVRNLEKEKIYEDKLISLGFTNQDGVYLFKGTDFELFNFLDVEIMQLKDLGDVYYSDKFKEKKIYKSNSILASIRDTLDGYLDFEFSISDIDKNEYKDILLSFKQRSKFYKLKNGSFLDLQENQTKDFFELVENLDLINSKDNRVHLNKMLYINDMVNSHNLQFIKGSEQLQDIVKSFKNIKELDLSVPENLNASLRDYQIAGLNYFKTLDHYNFGGILADEMGLGKTIQTIAFLLFKKNANPNTKSLIIAPTSLIYNWKSEFEKFAPSMNVLLIHGGKKEREKLLKDRNNYDVIITTYATLRNDIDEYNDKSFDYCILDEAQNIKNPIAQSTVAVKTLNARVRFALTGTPIENNLLELWSIFDFIMPGYLYNRNKFQDIFIYDEYNAENLKRLIRPFVLRRTKKEVMTELPDKIENKFLIELNKDQRKVYSAYINEIKDKINNKNIKTDKITIFSYLTKLRQLCLDPNVLLDDYNKKSSKIETALELIKEYTEDGHKILLFSQFTSVLKNIGIKLSKNDIAYHYIDGQTEAKKRLELVNQFNENEDVKVFLVSLKAGGTGLNLTSADIVIHFDPWWNPAVENQASDRAHRFGQKNVVQVIKLIAKGTIEEKIVTLQENKNELIQKFINGDLSDSSMLKNLSDEDIVHLFS